MKIQIFAKPTIIHGWQATLGALASANIMTSEPHWAILPLASFGNLFLLFAAPFIKRAQTKLMTTAYLLSFLVCIACASATPLLLAKFNPTLQLGYFVWIAALFCSLIAAIIQLVQSGASPSVDGSLQG